MDKASFSKESTVEKLSKIAHVVDFMVYLIRTISEHLDKLCENLESLPGAFTTLYAAELIDDVMDSINGSAGLITKILPSKKICDKNKYRKFWLLHSALIFYHYDAWMLLRHSLLSAFIGYYSAAFTELRSAMESIVRGMVFDLLAIPQYRREAIELQKIKGFKNTVGFPELLEVFEGKLDNKRPSASIEIFDIIDEELKKFNPEASFIKLLKQLKVWRIIDEDLFRETNAYYAELSKHAHRLHPRFSEVGSRVMADKDWIELEPVPEELFTYLYSFIEFNGLLTYLVLRVFSIDLMCEEYRDCIDWKALEEDIQKASKLARNYKTWERTKDLLEKLRALACQASETNP